MAVSCLPLQLGIFVRCDVSFDSCFFALMPCHMCDLKSYDLSSSLWTQQIWCVSWITSNISSVWSWFISESVTLSAQHDKQSLSAKFLPQVMWKRRTRTPWITRLCLQHPTDTGLTSKACHRHHAVSDKPGLKLCVWCCSVEGKNADKHSNLLEMQCSTFTVSVDVNVGFFFFFFFFFFF